MPFEPLRVRAGDGEGDPRLHPVVQADGTPRWEPGDTNVKMWPAVAAGSCQGAIDNQRTNFSLEARFYVTDARAILVASRFAKGTRHSGPLISSAVQNKISKNRAERAAAGMYLVGQMRYPWVNRIVFAPPAGRKGRVVRLCGMHSTAFGEQESVMLIVHFDQYTDPGPIASEIAGRVIADRRDWSRTSEQTRAALAATWFTAPGDLAPGTLPSIAIPGGWVVSAGSAGNGAASGRAEGWLTR